MSPLAVPAYLAVVAITALGAMGWRRWGRHRNVALWLATPILAVGCLAGAGAPEGLVDAMTPGVLIAVLLTARGHRLVALAAAVLVAEELDWGQVLAGFPTPEWHGLLPSRSSTFNFHNVRGLDWLWQPLPLLVLVAMTRSGPWVERAEQMGFPRMDPRLLRVLLALFAMSPAVYLVGGARPFDEAFELASAWAFYAGWRVVWEPRPS